MGRIRFDSVLQRMKINGKRGTRRSAKLPSPRLWRRRDVPSLLSAARGLEVVHFFEFIFFFCRFSYLLKCFTFTVYYK